MTTEMALNPTELYEFSGLCVVMPCSSREPFVWDEHIASIFRAED
jgi:hypothetical protein